MGRLRDSACTAIAPLAWGTAYVVTTELLPPDRPLFTATMRALPVGVAFLVVTRRFPSGVWWMRAMVLGALTRAPMDRPRGPAPARGCRRAFGAAP